MDAITVLNLRESKEAGPKVKELGEQGALVACTAINLEYGYHVVDETLLIIGSKAVALVDLNLNACQECTDVGLQDLAKGCSTLKSLSLYWNVKYTDAGISAIVSANRGLERLSVSGCKFLCDAGLVTIAQSCTGLSELDLTRCVNITDKALVSVATHCLHLTSLLLYASAAPADEGLEAVFENLSKLQVLDLCGSKGITDKGFERLLEGASGRMGALRRLNLGWCCNLADPTLDAVARGCPALLYLYLLGNKLMSSHGVAKISQGCRNVCGLDICGLNLIQDRSLATIGPMFPKLSMLAKLGIAPNYDDF